MEATSLRSIATNFLVAIALLVIGGLLNNYFFKEKPALSYQTYEADPVETESGVYYSTSVLITNSGDTPLSTVAVFLKFAGKVIRVNSNIRGGTTADDSLNVKREFRMPLSTFAEIKVTSRGKLVETDISSAEVIAMKRDDVAKDKKTISDLREALVILSLFFLATLFGIYAAFQEKRKRKAAKADESLNPETK